jgi:hypothetical protein
MTKLWPILATVYLFSCKQSYSVSLENTLKSNCFWDITEDKQVIGGLNSCYRFLPDGQCYFYYYYFINKSLTRSVFRYDDDDIIVPDTWAVIGDSLLIARGTQYTVLAFSKDSIIVEGYLNDTLIFRKNCQTMLGKP